MSAFRRASLACAAVAALASTSARAAVINGLTEDFSAATINAAKFQVVASDFEAGTGTYTSNTTTVPGQLTIAGNTSSSYWGGQIVQTVDSFDSAKQTTITVQRTPTTGAGSAFRSALWIDQQPGAGTGSYLMFSQNVGEGGWQTNANTTGTGNNIPAFDAQDGNLGSVEMKLVYRPLGGTNAEVDVYLNNVLGTTVAFNNWDNTNDFQVRLSGMARAAAAEAGTGVNDTVSASFDNLVVAVPEPTTLGGLGLAAAALLARRQRRSRA